MIKLQLLFLKQVSITFQLFYFSNVMITFCGQWINLVRKNPFRWILHSWTKSLLFFFTEDSHFCEISGFYMKHSLYCLYSIFKCVIIAADYNYWLQLPQVWKGHGPLLNKRKEQRNWPLVTFLAGHPYVCISSHMSIHKFSIFDLICVL